MPENTPVRRLGDFELIRELGSGGMGTVWLAKQESLNRYVALKVLLAPFGKSANSPIHRMQLIMKKM